jgi:uncharacterized protein (DUF1697 family)
MSTQIAFLRAINVGGTGKMPMAELRAVAEKAGLKNARTLLQSGNLVFDAGAKAPAASEKLLEKACEAAFGVRTDIYVRGAAELEAVAANNPFTSEAIDDPGHLHVIFMRAVPPAKAFETLQAAIKGRERVRGFRNHAYIHFPDGSGASKVTPTVIARHLGQPGTARNWNTVRKLLAVVAGP